MRELIFKEEAGRIGSNSVLNNFSRVELNDKEDIKAFKTEDINGKEICRKERVPMSGEKPFPRQ